MLAKLVVGNKKPQSPEQASISRLLKKPAAIPKTEASVTGSVHSGSEEPWSVFQKSPRLINNVFSRNTNSSPQRPHIKQKRTTNPKKLKNFSKFLNTSAQKPPPEIHDRLYQDALIKKQIKDGRKTPSHLVKKWNGILKESPTSSGSKSPSPERPMFLACRSTDNL